MFSHTAQSPNSEFPCWPHALALRLWWLLPTAFFQRTHGRRPRPPRQENRILWFIFRSSWILFCSFANPLGLERHVFRLSERCCRKKTRNFVKQISDNGSARDRRNASTGAILLRSMRVLTLQQKHCYSCNIFTAQDWQGRRAKVGGIVHTKGLVVCYWQDDCFFFFERCEQWKDKRARWVSVFAFWGN